MFRPVIDLKKPGCFALSKLNDDGIIAAARAICFYAWNAVGKFVD
jgi:hypothetical protein